MQKQFMAHSATFPPIHRPSFAGSFSRTAKEMALAEAFRRLPVSPGPVSYPLGLAMGIFAAHVGYVLTLMLFFESPSFGVALVLTLITVVGFLALLPGRDRWVLTLAAVGSGAGLYVAPRLVDNQTLVNVAWLYRAVESAFFG